MKPVKILGLLIENVKKLVVVEIKPSGNMVQITGKNGQGKTSVLDSIWWALAGTANIQGVPIRQGESVARIRLDLGEVIVTRTFKAKEDGDYSSAITVETVDGARFQSPQALLDSMLGALTFDPLEFSRMKPRDQYDTLRKFVPGVDFDGLERANKADFDKRTELNRKIKDMTALAAAIEVTPVDPSTPLIDESALVEELTKAGRENTDLKVREERRISGRNQISNLREQAARLVEQADSLDRELADAAPLPPLKDLSHLQQEIQQARTANELTRSGKQKWEIMQRAQSTHAEAEALTAAIEVRRNQVKAAVAQASFPVKGLTFGDGQVLLAGVPFEQASDAEQLRASIAIAMALNPKLKVVRVRDGSLLDENSMKVLEEMAEAADAQVWIERVDSSGKVGFVLEEGRIKQ